MYNMQNTAAYITGSIPYGMVKYTKQNERLLHSVQQAACVCGRNGGCHGTAPCEHTSPGANVKLQSIQHAK